MGNDKQIQANGTSPEAVDREAWIKPEIVSFEPVKAAQGISYNPQDGISNLT
jgi:hypothetical protein